MSPQVPQKASQGKDPTSVKHSGAQNKITAPIGGLILAKGDIEFNAGRRSLKLIVRNTGDRPIQVGSHFHFFEVNRALDFDREKAFGMHLDIPASTGIRFEPGDQKEVQLVDFAGKKAIYGFNDLVDGWTGTGPTPQYRPRYPEALRRAAELGFKTIKK